MFGRKRSRQRRETSHGGSGGEELVEDEGKETKDEGSKKRDRRGVFWPPAAEEEDDDEAYKYDWNGGDYGVYMQEKERKLREQYGSDGSIAVDGDYFRGVVIWVDGLTHPGRDELRRLVYGGGGRLETYFHPRIVTHVVATHFPKFKVEQLRKAMASTVVHQYVVTPDWIVQSRAEKRRLLEADFQVPGMRDETQKTLSSVFRKPIARAEPERSGLAAELAVEAEDVQAPVIADSVSTADEGVTRDVQLERGQEDVRRQEDERVAKTAAVRISDNGMGGSVVDPNKQHGEEATKAIINDGSRTTVDAVQHGDQEHPEVLMSSPKNPHEDDAETVVNDDDLPPLVPGLRSEREHLSTRDNPNFVRDYFSSSRLHYIGSFRARYESLLTAIAARRGCSPSDLLRVRTADQEVSPSERSWVIHVDMDCFFVAVAVAKDPTLAGRALVVCHSGGGEISSASYEARECGVRAGMMTRDAVKLCPHLETIQYDFEAYERVTLQIYSIFFDYAVAVEAVSIDEAYLDVTGVRIQNDARAHILGLSDLSPPEQVARVIRYRIAEDTRCAASAGIATNKLLARLATKKAKPDGQFLLLEEHASEFIAGLPVDDLPGVGWSTAKKLDEVMDVTTCRNLQSKSKQELQQLLGDRNGEALYNTCRGVDVNPVVPLKPRKSIGAEVGWGVRFEADEGDKVVRFMRELASVVAERVKAAHAVGRKLNLKVMRKKKGAGMPYKSLGHGPCDVFNRTTRIETTGMEQSIAENSLKLLRAFRVPYEELRGVAIHISDLEFDGFTSGKCNRIDSFLEKKVAPQGERAVSGAASVATAGPQRLPPLPPPPVAASSSTSAAEPPGGRWPRAAVAIGKAAAKIPSGWDVSVFQELPLAIQMDILNEQSSLGGRRDEKHSKAWKAKKRSPSGPRQATMKEFASAQKRDMIGGGSNARSPRMYPVTSPLPPPSSQDGIHLIFGEHLLQRLTPILRDWMCQHGDLALLEACVEELLAAHRVCRCVEMIRLISLLAHRIGGEWPARVVKLRVTARKLARSILDEEMNF